MRFTGFSLFLFTALRLFSQGEADYVIMLNNDTLFTGIVRLDKNMLFVVGEEKGRKTKYEARDILEVRSDTSIYESGLLKLKRTKHYVLLRRTVVGKLNLYEIQIHKSKILWKNFGEDFIRLRWIYRSQQWAKRVYSTAYFYKKTGESRKSFSKSWKEKTGDCDLIRERTVSKTSRWVPSPVELVIFYNENCR